ncbi:aldehyde dehydrogenase [Mycena epipterygia]|nr:aldehyde dehydrogenase [Mycena epipterygia]
MQYTPISDIPEIRDSLRKSFRAGVPRPLEWRKNQLLQLARMVQENAAAFTQAATNDLGRPKVETYLAEFGTIVERCLISAKNLEEWAKPVNVEVPDMQKPWSPTVYKAGKGTVLIIAPWNYPMYLSLQPLLGAIAAGCCAVVKPSEISPHYSALLSKLVPKYLDSRAYRVVLGGVPEITKLLELQFCYTGNAHIARVIATAAAKYLTPLTLELGGKCPVIIDPAFDLKIAAKRILWGKALNCGQLCVAPDYVLIPRTHQAAFVEAFTEAYKESFPDGSLASDSIARIVSVEHHARLADILKRTTGKVVLGGKAEGLKLELTLVTDVGGNDSLMEGEIFGPILPIVPVDSVHDAIEFVRDRPHPLVLYAFTEAQELKTQLIDETLSGGLVFNDLFMQLAVNELPLGGVGESGYGSQVLKYGFDSFSYERASIDIPKEAEPFLAFRYHPFTQATFDALSGPALLEIPKKI